MTQVQQEETGTATELHPTTSVYRPSKGGIEIMKQCRIIRPRQTQASWAQSSQSVERIWNASELYLDCTDVSAGPELVVQFVVAAKDEETNEIWECNATSRRNQIYLTSDGTFRIAAYVLEPNALVSSRKSDFRSRELARYAGTLMCVLPAEEPMTYTIVIQLLHKTHSGQEDVVLDAKQFFVQTHEQGMNFYDQQNGISVSNIEKPVSKLRMTGALSGDYGRKIMQMFQHLGDNGLYKEFANNQAHLCHRFGSNSKVKDVQLAVRLEESITQFGQNKEDACIATCDMVCADSRNLANSNFLQIKAFYIISAVYRQRKDWPKALEYMELSNELVETVALCEETAVNRYNMGALLAEMAATEDGITEEQYRFAEKCFCDVAWIWKQQKENPSNRDVIRAFNKLISLYLKTSRQRFPDLSKDVSMNDIYKAWETCEKVERELFAESPKRLQATFLIGKADCYIRQATVRKPITEEDRRQDLVKGEGILDEAIAISIELKMKKEIDGIRDRQVKITALLDGGLHELNLPSPTPRTSQNQHGNRKEPSEGICFEDLLEDLILEQSDTRTEVQCTDAPSEHRM